MGTKLLQSAVGAVSSRAGRIVGSRQGRQVVVVQEGTVASGSSWQWVQSKGGEGSSGGSWQWGGEGLLALGEVIIHQ